MKKLFYLFSVVFVLMFLLPSCDFTVTKYNITVRNDASYGKITKFYFWYYRDSSNTATNLLASGETIEAGESKTFKIAEKDKRYNCTAIYENGDEGNIDIEFSLLKVYEADTTIPVSPEKFSKYTVTNKIGSTYEIHLIVFQPSDFYDKCYYYGDDDYPYYTIYGTKNNNTALDSTKILVDINSVGNSKAEISNQEAAIYDIYTLAFCTDRDNVDLEDAYYWCVKKNVSLTKSSTNTWDVSYQDVLNGYIYNANKIKLKNKID